MRNPWEIYGIAAFTAIGCCAWDYFFSYKSLWIPVLMILVLWVFCIFVGIQYEMWLAAKVNTHMRVFQSDHDLEKLEKRLDHWRKWAFSRWAQNTIMENWLVALLEEEHWEEAEELLEQFHCEARSAQEEIDYHLLRKEYASAIGDTELENQEQILYEACKNQLIDKWKDKRKPAKATEYKGAFFCWLLFSLFLLFSGVIINIIAGESMLGSVGAGLVILSLFSFPVSLVWLTLWIVQRRKENVP